MSRDVEPVAEFNGECAFAVSLGKQGVTGRHNCQAKRNGKRYLFSNPVARLLWWILPGRRQAAERHWAER